LSGGLDYGRLLDDLEGAFEEVALAALGHEHVGKEGRRDAPDPQCQGAYLGLVSTTGAVQIGIASDETGCQSLARGLMGTDGAEPPFPAAELADAVCEIVNIVAGGFKSRARERAGALTLGLPVFFRGPAQATDHTAVEVSVVRLGSTAVSLLLVHPRSHSSD
jgi:hypothetical protein